MTRDETKQLLPIITAFANGETVQLKDHLGWTDWENPDFNAAVDRYRIKPKPGEFWQPDHSLCYSSKAECERDWPGRKIIHVKEVV